MPGVGVEPTWPEGPRILSPLRLPFRHPGRGRVDRCAKLRHVLRHARPVNRRRLAFARTSGSGVTPNDTGTCSIAQVLPALLAVWRAGAELRAGDWLLSMDGHLTMVETIELIGRGVRTYNLEVEGDHTFFVHGYLSRTS